MQLPLLYDHLVCRSRARAFYHGQVNFTSALRTLSRIEKPSYHSNFGGNAILQPFVKIKNRTCARAQLRKICLIILIVFLVCFR